ncbi:MAG: DUF3592 domain-containing protein [Bryobacteraceae bacterium]
MPRGLCYIPHMGVPPQEVPYLLLGYAVLFCGLLAWLGWRKWTLKHWPTTPGKVEGYAQGGYPVDSRPWLARGEPITLLYSYTANGEYYSGEVVLPGRIASNAAQASKALPVGTSIEVHYSPNKPGRSTARIPDQRKS